jgi:SNF2 family DNA or RNA helicase
MFDGKPVIDYPLGDERTIRHYLTPSERIAQDRAHMWWAPKTKKTDRSSGAGYDLSEKRKALISARLSLAHEDCPDANYGSIADKDIITDEKAIHSLQSKKHKFKKSLANGRWQSSRVQNLLKRVVKHQASARGKVLVFSEYLCALDVVEVGLQESGIGFLHFHNTLNTQQRTKVVIAFATDSSKFVLLITSRSGGVGLSFVQADLVFHLT